MCFNFYSIILAQSDGVEILPFVIFVLIIIGRIMKAFSKRARGGEEAPDLEQPPPVATDDPIDQLRRFMEEVRRQSMATGEAIAPSAPPPVPPPHPGRRHMPAQRQSAARQVPVAGGSSPRVHRPEFQRTPPPARKRPEAGRGVKAAPPRRAAAPLAATVQSAPQIHERPIHPLALSTLKKGTRGLREAILLREVFGPPLGLRDRSHMP